MWHRLVSGTVAGPDAVVSPVPRRGREQFRVKEDISPVTRQSGGPPAHGSDLGEGVKGQRESIGQNTVTS